MSILLATAALLAVQSPFLAEPLSSVEVVENREIVVTAQQLKKFRATIEIRKKTGEPYCRVKRSSGDRAFDAGMCAAMVNCHARVASSEAIAAARDARAPKKEVERIWVDAATMCMRPFFEGSGFD